MDAADRWKGTKLATNKVRGAQFHVSVQSRDRVFPFSKQLGKSVEFFGLASQTTIAIKKATKCKSNPHIHACCMQFDTKRELALPRSCAGRVRTD